MPRAFYHGRIVLLSGASSGIGAETALLLAEQGYTVYGASRRGILPAGVRAEALEKAGALRAIAMDVTDEASIAVGIARIQREAGDVEILIHAAGDGYAGPAECSAAEDAQRQMDVNYFGALRLLNAVLPAMRSKKRGLVVLVGSVGGIFSIPFQTLYSSSKAALAMLSDGLRLELRPFHVHTTLVAPGDVRTPFTAARKSVSRSCPEAYGQHMQHAIARMEKDELGGMPPEKVARAICKTVGKRRPPAQRIVGGTYRVFAFLKRLLPYGIVEKLLYRMYA